MNASRPNNASVMNSLIAPLNMVNNAAKNVGSATANFVNNAAKNVGFNLGNIGNIGNAATNSGSSSGWLIGLFIFLALVGIFIGLMIQFQNEIKDAWNNVSETITAYFNPAAPTPAAATQDASGIDQSQTLPSLASAAGVVEKVLPGGSEVFNVSSNRFTYYDAAPLCKALGAELATYDQVKEAWNKGADWCNYGWVKGQMAVYPTSDATFAKLQEGPEEQRMACGRPGVNGGYFDNPEQRFGVNCYGTKPSKSQHDSEEMSKGAPVSPDALAFDKKVNQYKSQVDSIGINPFNSSRW